MSMSSGVTTSTIELEEGQASSVPTIVKSRSTAPSVWSKSKTTHMRLEGDTSCKMNCLLFLLFLIFAMLASLLGVLINVTRQAVPAINSVNTLADLAKNATVDLNHATQAMQAMSEVAQTMSGPTQVGLDNITHLALELEPLIQEIRPLTRALANGQSTFASLVRNWGPPESVPQFLTNMMMLHVGNLTSALARIGRKLEPKLQHWRYANEELAYRHGATLGDPLRGHLLPRRACPRGRGERARRSAVGGAAE
jgi:hypothetical protein